MYYIPKITPWRFTGFYWLLFGVWFPFYRKPVLMLIVDSNSWNYKEGIIMVIRLKSDKNSWKCDKLKTTLYPCLYLASHFIPALSYMWFFKFESPSYRSAIFMVKEVQISFVLLPRYDFRYVFRESTTNFPQYQCATQDIKDTLQSYSPLLW